MAELFTDGKFQAFDASGDPLSGGLLYSYAPGTLTAKTTYTTQAATVANSNPVVLDSAGRASVWLTGVYRMILKDSEGVTQWDVDSIRSSAESGGQLYVRDYGALLDGSTDDLDAFNAAIADIPSGESAEIIVDGVAYLSAATTNGGRYPNFIFRPGAATVNTPGGTPDGTMPRLTWPVRWSAQQVPNGAFHEYIVGGNDANNGDSRGTYTEITGNRATNSTNSYGNRLGYRSHAYGSGFDIATAVIANWNRDAGDDAGQGLAQWLVAISPQEGGYTLNGDPASTRSGTFVQEMNVVNRYADMGWGRKRGIFANWTGIAQIIPESQLFAQPGTSHNVLFGLAFTHSADAKADGIKAQVYNAIQVEEGAIAGGGFCIYAAGNESGVAAQDPHGFIGVEATWHTGIDLSEATFVDTRAIRLGSMQRLAWIEETSYALTFTAALVAAESGTLTAPFAGVTGKYELVFANETSRMVTLTNGSTAVSWKGIFSGSASASYKVVTTLSGITAQAQGLVIEPVPGEYANDAAAAIGGVSVGGLYRIGSALQVRVT